MQKILMNYYEYDKERHIIMVDVYLLPANEGDCLWVRYGKKEGTRHNIIIDGGVESNGGDIASIIENIAERNEKVDIFVTHIDGDHIRGLIKGIKKYMWNAERRSEKLQIEKENKIVELDKIQKNLEKELSLYFSKSTMNEIYQKIDPHDVMKRLEYHLSFNDAQKGELFITLSESESDSDSDYRPEIYFSTAQLNTVAFSSFFSRALDRKNNLPIQTIFIDDPIGHFDDMNILGFADLMRSLIDNSNWQIVISTHDEKIFRILQRKLSGEYYSSCFLKLPSGKGIKWIE